MRAVLKTNNAVILSYAAHVLAEARVEHVIFDENASVMDGSMGFLPRRLMVLDEDYATGERLQCAAVPEEIP